MERRDVVLLVDVLVAWYRADPRYRLDVHLGRSAAYSEEPVSRESVSITEAAKLLSVSRWTIWRLVRDGALPAFRVRRCKRIFVGDIQRLKREGHVAGRS